jgi:hypothetical protein
MNVRGGAAHRRHQTTHKSLLLSRNRKIGVQVLLVCVWKKTVLQCCRSSRIPPSARLKATKQPHPTFFSITVALSNLYTWNVAKEECDYGVVVFLKLNMSPNAFKNKYRWVVAVTEMISNSSFRPTSCLLT